MDVAPKKGGCEIDPGNLIPRFRLFCVEEINGCDSLLQLCIDSETFEDLLRQAVEGDRYLIDLIGAEESGKPLVDQDPIGGDHDRTRRVLADQLQDLFQSRIEERLAGAGKRQEFPVTHIGDECLKNLEWISADFAILDVYFPLFSIGVGQAEPAAEIAAIVSTDLNFIGERREFDLFLSILSSVDIVRTLSRR